MSVKIPVAQLGRFERALCTLMPKSVHKGMQRGGRDILKRLREETAAKKIRDRGAFAAGWAMAFTAEHELSIFNWAPHAVFVERGRRKGARRPPIQPIFEWTQRRFGNTNLSLAFAIANSISKRGIAPRPVMYAPGMLRAMGEIMSKSIREAAWDTVRELLPR